MSATGAPFSNERIRLWTSSALAALLAHLTVAALLLLLVQRAPPLPRGTADALDVQLADPPPALLRSTAVAPAHRDPVQSASQAAATATLPIKPLPQLPPIPQQPFPPPSLDAVAASAPRPADLTLPAPALGEATAPPTPRQLWAAQIKAQLGRYGSYPRSAMKRRQEDAVTLQITVNQAGQVVSSSVESPHHYRALEDEARHMLRLAGRLPVPPQQPSDGQIVLHVPIDFQLREPPAVAVSCAGPGNPGAAPVGAQVTLAQLQAYRQRLAQYVAAARRELDCLGGGSGPAVLSARNAVVSQMQRLVAAFNAQARAFQAKAFAALQAQQAAAARLAQAQAAAARGYAACTPPSTPGPMGATLMASAAQTYRKQLLDDAAAVRSYVACIRIAQQAAGSTLTDAQRAVLARTAVQLANDVVLPYDHAVAMYNAQLPTRQASHRALVSARTHAPAAMARAPAAFLSSWDTPAPLPAGNCIRITLSAGAFQAQLCRTSYTNPSIVIHSHMPPGTFGIGSAPTALDGPQTSTYVVRDLQVIGNHLMLTIQRRSDVAPSSDADNWNALHLDLVLAADGRRLVGKCSTAQKRWDCQLPRHQH